MKTEMLSHVSITVLTCARLCVAEGACTTFTVSLAAARCRLHSDKMTSDDTLQPGPGFVTYDTDRRESPGVAVSLGHTDMNNHKQDLGL